MSDSPGWFNMLVTSPFTLSSTLWLIFADVSNLHAHTHAHHRSTQRAEAALDDRVIVKRRAPRAPKDAPSNEAVFTAKCIQLLLVHSGVGQVAFIR